MKLETVKLIEAFPLLPRPEYRIKDGLIAENWGHDAFDDYDENWETWLDLDYNDLEKGTYMFQFSDVETVKYFMPAYMLNLYAEIDAGSVSGVSELFSYYLGGHYKLSKEEHSYTQLQAEIIHDCTQKILSNPELKWWHEGCP
ncbi:hypothetical protein Rhal01_03413 [Rubritalea halochordaticola]|uniref:Uncharacterized protein n=1 Tax=Rubritalea halochordaticola TaxID=714537 RepID=A0ABP9V3N0_9BACT